MSTAATTHFLRFVPLFPTAVAIPFRGIGGHPVANFRTEVESVENNVRRGGSATSKLGMVAIACSKFHTR
jgi:hypothetical protein